MPNLFTMTQGLKKTFPKDVDMCSKTLGCNVCACQDSTTNDQSLVKTTNTLICITYLHTHTQPKEKRTISKRKYLLVLDDVWTENQDKRLKLLEFLINGPMGSWIVVTTCSRRH